MGGANVFLIRIFKGRRGDRAGANLTQLNLSALLSELILSLVAGDRACTIRDTARMCSVAHGAGRGRPQTSQPHVKCKSQTYQVDAVWGISCDTVEGLWF